MRPIWSVLFDVNALRKVVDWPSHNRVELDAIQSVLREGGPEALGWNADERTGYPSWDVLREPYVAVYWTAFEQRFYRVSLEVRPERTVIVRDATTGVYQRGPRGR